MKPNWYMNIDLTGAQEKEAGIPASVLRGKLLSFLHPVFKTHPNTFALAITNEHKRLRVFASSLEELVMLGQRLNPQPWIRDYTRFDAPIQVPDDFSGTWTSFTRYRIPTEKTDRKQGDERGQLRQRRLQTATEERMDYFMLRSKSTSQFFTLIIQRKNGEAPATNCFPNSYGFSVNDRPFSLPDLP